MPRPLVILLTMLLSCGSTAPAAPPASRPSTSALPADAPDYAAAAREVMRHIQTTFYLPKEGLYAHSAADRHPDFMWGNGVMFSALLGAARHDPDEYAPLLSRFFGSLNRYWDSRSKPPGYEPSPTAGNGNDKYYDDNAWLVLNCTEAFALTKDPRYLQRGRETLAFVLSGWDEQQGGGIWWHVGHKGDCKNTCANAPAAVGCLRMARIEKEDRSKAAVATSKRIVDWTSRTLRQPEGLFADSINVVTGKINTDRLTYNTALMIRAYLGLYRATGDDAYLEEAKRSAAAADWFLDEKTNAYRDSVKWSHLLVEADLEMYRATQNAHLLQRAIDNAKQEYAAWKAHRPDELIDNASVARTLWLMADMQSEAGQRFWKSLEAP